MREFPSFTAECASRRFAHMFASLRALAALPYSQPFKRAALGLFHGKTKQYGNNVPFSKHKTRRTWLPNAHSKALYSETMRGWLRTTVTARTLRTIDKVRSPSCRVGRRLIACRWAGSTIMSSTHGRICWAGRACGCGL